MLALVPLLQTELKALQDPHHPTCTPFGDGIQLRSTAVSSSLINFPHPALPTDPAEVDATQLPRGQPQSQTSHRHTWGMSAHNRQGWQQLHGWQHIMPDPPPHQQPIIIPHRISGF